MRLHNRRTSERRRTSSAVPSTTPLRVAAAALLGWSLIASLFLACAVRAEEPSAFSFADCFTPSPEGPITVLLDNPQGALFVGDRVEIYGQHLERAAVQRNGQIVYFDSLDAGDDPDPWNEISSAVVLEDGRPLYVGSSLGFDPTDYFVYHTLPTYWFEPGDPQSPRFTDSAYSVGWINDVAETGMFVGGENGGSFSPYFGLPDEYYWTRVPGTKTPPGQSYGNMRRISRDGAFALNVSHIWRFDEFGSFDFHSTENFDFSDTFGSGSPAWADVASDGEGRHCFAGSFQNVDQSSPGLFNFAVGFWTAEGEFLHRWGADAESSANSFDGFALVDGELIAGVSMMYLSGAEGGLLVRISDGASVSLEELTGQATFSFPYRPAKCLFSGDGELGLLLRSGATTCVHTFRYKRPVNAVPTVEPLQAASLEYKGGEHVATLSTVVDDADDHPLTVTWTVDGKIEQSEANVAAGTNVPFEFAYDHGVHEVVLEVSDGLASATAGTTVTVQDTQNPILVVASDVVVGTDPGKAFASNVVLPPPTASDASGHSVTLTSDARTTYALGVTLVTWTATDESGNQATATQKVIVQDQEPPTVSGESQVRVFCDRGKLFSTVEPPQPAVSDNVDDPARLVVASDAKARFPIGRTRVTFTVADAAGNKSTWPVDVIVVNRKPRANAGRNVALATTSEQGGRVTLDGSRSSDPDKHKLKYAWKAKGVKLARAKTPKPVGDFPIGRTTVTLTVTDAGGLKHKDTVTVTVKLKNAKRRPRGADANRSFAAATQEAASAVCASGSGGSALSGLAYASAATAYGDAAGEFVRWEEGQSEADALPAYAEIRALQRAYGEAAANAMLAAYAETGDESLLSAYRYAVYGTAYAAADLSER